ncbi:hypothetical protein Tco_1015916 [Tanacetum coccineum]|uniref:Retrovirus-related Pol polyprotein from transposon TNT 1-94-like beta-barrel domain-containing protein n=1 Tax=Tanacetum coccineum TaxID=301880 RepID=A0ABQ5FM70_9ASTR
MEHYLAHTDYPIWEVIQNGNGPISITKDTQGQIKVLPLRTAEEILAREREKKARTTLLMALPEDHLAKFHKMTDAKEMWKAIKSRFGGNDESKKMQKSLPSTWSQVSLIMRTKPGVDNLNFDDLYNNLRVFENDVKGSTASSSSTQNVAFVSENTNSTNDVSTAYGVSNSTGQNSQYEHTSSYSLLANQSSCPQLDHEDLEQLDEFDLEEMDLKWQVAMISMRMKKFYKKTGRKLQFDGKEPVDNRRRDAWNSRNKDGRRSGKQEDSKALVTIDGEGVDWTSHSEEEEDYALMACNSSGSDTKVSSCLKECKESYAKLKKLYDEQRAQLSDASIEIQAYTQGLKKVEAQLVAHQQGQLWYEQKIKFMKIDLDDKTDVLTYHKKLLAEAQKEKDDLKAKVEKWHNSSKNLGNYIPSGPDIEIDYSQFTYGPKQSQPSEFETQTSEFDTCESNISTETPELVSEPVVNEPNVVCQPKVWSDAPIIEEETVKNIFTHNKNPKVDKKGMGYRFTTRACFVCISLSHLIRDCDFHEKRMAKQAELNNRIRKKSSQREIRPIWNNVQRMNHKNQFVPSAILTKTGTIPVSTIRASGTNNVSTARYNFNRQAVPTNAAMKVNTAKQLVLLGDKGKLLLSPQQVVIGDHKDTTGTKSPNTMVDQDYLHKALQNKGIVDSGCSRHMTGNKAYLAEYQDFNGGPVAFGGKLQHFNLFSVSQMRDKKNKVLFTDSECLVLSPEFKLPDAN